VNCRVCERTVMLELIVIASCKCPINPFTNPNPVYILTQIRDIFKTVGNVT
jgi:hypothetical protein